jgi:methylmalonyl-CoA epimerase
MIKRIDHVAIAVKSLEETLHFFRDVLGLELDHTEAEAAQRVVVAFLPAGESEIELVEPVGSDSGVARFLAKRGEGMHHICFEVENLDDALAKLRAKGVQLIDEVPYEGTGGKRIAFVHPSAAHGVLMELYESSAHEPRRMVRDLDSLRRRMVIESRAAAAGTRGFIRSLTRPRPGNASPD